MCVFVHVCAFECVCVRERDIVIADVFVLALTKQAKQECAFLCLNKEM